LHPNLFTFSSTQFLIWSLILKIALKRREKSLKIDFSKFNALLKILKSENPRKIH